LQMEAQTRVKSSWGHRSTHILTCFSTRFLRKTR
jgi:hypothetical protein